MHARCIHDKLPSFLNVINSLSAQGRFEDAVDAGLLVLAQLGETFKTDYSRNDMTADFVKVKHVMESSLAGAGDPNASIDEIILRSPLIFDNPGIDKATARDKAAVMRLITHLMRPLHRYNQFMSFSMTLRAIQLSLSCGLCQYSIMPFATYGVFLARRFMKIEEANKFGKLCLDLIERLDAMDEMPQIHMIVFSYIFPRVRPVQSLVPELRRAYDLAMRSGRIAVAMSACRQISHLLLSCDGTPSLESAVTEMQEYVYQMMKLREGGNLGSCLPFLQYFLILMGDGGDDPSVLCGRAMNYESSLKEALSKSDAVTILDINTVRIRLLYLFGKYNEAGRLVKDVLSLHEKLTSDSNHSDMLGHTLYCGLTAAVLGCSNPHEAEEWHQIAVSTLKKYELYAVHSEWNFAHRVALLKAEVAHFINYDSEAALKHYKVAIDLAEQHKFPGEKALALERAAMFCEGTCQTDLAQVYYKEAERAYREWGAIRKADHVACNVMEVF